MALSFNGSNQYVIKNSDLGITGGVITLSIWVKLNAEISSGEWCFVSQIDAGTHVKYAIDYKYNSGTRQLSFYRTRYTVVDNQATYNITLGTSNWYHLVLTYDGSNVKGYVNGVLQAGPTASSGNGTSRGSDCFVVASEDGAGLYANATLFDARCYNRVITDNEISEIYHKRGADRVWQGLVGWWKMDSYERGTTTVVDELNSATGWSCHSCTVSNNSINQDGSAGSLNITKTVGTDVYAKKTITTTNLLNKWIGFWVYIKDSATLAKLNDIQVFLSNSADTWGLYRFFYDLKVGWQRLECDVAGMTTSAGTPDRTQVSIIRIDTDCNVSETTWAEGDVIVDYFYSFSPTVMDLSGNGNKGNLIGGTLQSSPHRLRRGVIIL